MTTPDIIIKRTCGHCAGPMLGYASLNNIWLCHPEEGMDCYRLVTIVGHGTKCVSCSALRATQPNHTLTDIERSEDGDAKRAHCWCGWIGDWTDEGDARAEHAAHAATEVKP